MNTTFKSVALAGLLALAAGGASAGVTVTFNHPEEFRDMPFTPWEREQILKELGDHFALLGRKLPPGRLDTGRRAGHRAAPRVLKARTDSIPVRRPVARRPHLAPRQRTPA